jgi:hypothetical protein
MKTTMQPASLGDTVEARLGEGAHLITWDAVVIAVKRTGRVIAKSAGFTAELTPQMLRVKEAAPSGEHREQRLARALNTGW